MQHDTSTPDPENFISACGFSKKGYVRTLFEVKQSTFVMFTFAFASVLSFSTELENDPFGRAAWFVTTASIAILVIFVLRRSLLTFLFLCLASVGLGRMLNTKVRGPFNRIVYSAIHMTFVFRSQGQFSYFPSPEWALHGPVYSTPMLPVGDGDTNFQVDMEDVMLCGFLAQKVVPDGEVEQDLYFYGTEIAASQKVCIFGFMKEEAGVIKPLFKGSLFVMNMASLPRFLLNLFWDLAFWYFWVLMTFMSYRDYFY